MAKTEDDTPGAARPAAKKAPAAVHLEGESLGDRLRPHIAKIAVAFAVVAVLIGAYFARRWWIERGERQRTTALAQSLEVLDRNIVPPPAAAGSGDDAPPPPPADSFPSTAARAEAALAELQKRGVTSLTGAAFHGGLLLDAGRLDEALATFRAGVSATGLEGAAAREAWAWPSRRRPARPPIPPPSSSSSARRSRRTARSSPSPAVRATTSRSITPGVSSRPWARPPRPRARSSRRSKRRARPTTRR
ncbi:MAG: hypothetical protein R2939_17805 [Kofleriaceae bacterium]